MITRYLSLWLFVILFVHASVCNGQAQNHVQRLFPDAIPFQAQKQPQPINENVVKSITIGADEISILYSNDSGVPVKPNLMIWVMNDDGVILDKLRDSWTFFTLKPGATKEKSFKISPSIDERLRFSQSFKWDEKPSWIVVFPTREGIDKATARLRGAKPKDQQPKPAKAAAVAMPVYRFVRGNDEIRLGAL